MSFAAIRRSAYIRLRLAGRGKDIQAFLPCVLSNPMEIWATMYRHKALGADPSDQPQVLYFIVVGGTGIEPVTSTV
jgi:hypothetical protein